MLDFISLWFVCLVLLNLRIQCLHLKQRTNHESFNTKQDTNKLCTCTCFMYTLKEFLYQCSPQHTWGIVAQYAFTTDFSLMWEWGQDWKCWCGYRLLPNRTLPIHLNLSFGRTLSTIIPLLHDVRSVARGCSLLVLEGRWVFGMQGLRRWEQPGVGRSSERQPCWWLQSTAACPLCSCRVRGKDTFIVHMCTFTVYMYMYMTTIQVWYHHNNRLLDLSTPYQGILCNGDLYLLCYGAQA